ncbi:hypothetical protein CC78DRAFT_538492 [Lojkania enalia]|uniref:Uncharacterized protein n=1 Tax=Lojkania enalia TaxID=147567 RepID=A0A9P4JYX3_9PLEO|nr:hypothetical protein CC78DRAFT_538492 [Didymosphaeria enalia]
MSHTASEDIYSSCRTDDFVEAGHRGRMGDRTMNPSAARKNLVDKEQSIQYEAANSDNQYTAAPSATPRHSPNPNADKDIKPPRPSHQSLLSPQQSLGCLPSPLPYTVTLRPPPSTPPLCSSHTKTRSPQDCTASSPAVPQHQRLSPQLQSSPPSHPQNSVPSHSARHATGCVQRPHAGRPCRRDAISAPSAAAHTTHPLSASSSPPAREPDVRTASASRASTRIPER